MNIVLSDLFEKQLELDANINNTHKVSHKSTKQERFLALLVELGELANETRCFKYWSLKPSSQRDILLDEYADGLHFILSLGLVFNFSFTVLDYESLSTSKKETTILFVEMYQKVINFRNSESLEDYQSVFVAFLSLGSCLGFSSEDIRNAYFKKLVINYTRQKNNY